MKVISVKGNVVTFDLSQDEHDILLRDGLQKWINKNIGENKVKVLPPNEIKADKNNTCEIGDEFAKECIDLAIIEAIKLGIEMDKAMRKTKKTKKSKKAKK